MADFHGLSYEFNSASLSDALRALTRTEGGALDIKVAFDGIASDSIELAFLGERSIEVTVPNAFLDDDRRDFFTYRWMCVWPLLVAVSDHGARGRTRLWLDDAPRGPGLAFCGNGTSQTLIPDSVFMRSEGYRSLRKCIENGWRPWTERKAQLCWRGASTGNRQILRLTDWRDLPRLKLCRLVKAIGRNDLFDVGLSELVQIWDPTELQAIAEAGIQREKWPQLRTLEHRHTIDIDGNSSSWQGLFTKLLMGATVIKIDSEVGFRQWYYDRLRPWTHFVPIGANLRELLEIAEWLVAHPAEAEAIAERGRALALSLTYEAVLAETAPRISAALKPS